MKNSYLHKGLGILFVFIVMFPLTMQAIHAIDNHEHVVCTAESEQHIHNKDLDCSFFHYQIKQNAIDFSSNFQFLENKVNLEIIPERPNQFSKTYLFSKSSRAPPIIILFQ